LWPFAWGLHIHILEALQTRKTEMNLSNLLSAIAISLLAATGAAHAETYEGVHPLTNGMLRSDVAREAVAAAHANNPYAEASDAGPARPIVNGLRRESVHAEAVAAARIGNLYSEAASAGTVALPGSARERQRSNGLARTNVRDEASVH
jgi:hypothetical protein